MINNIPTISTIGLVMFLVFYIICALCYINLQKYHFFFVPLMIGFGIIIFDFLYNISKIVKIKGDLLKNNSNIGKIESCPEYWKKIISKDSVNCSNKDVLPGNISLASLQENTVDKYNFLNYKDIDLTKINVKPNEEKCNSMFQSYYNYTDDEMKVNNNLDNKNAVSWIEYHNKCLVNL